MSRQSQQPYPVQGDSLPEPTVVLLNSILRAATTGRDSNSKPNSPLPPFRSDRATPGPDLWGQVDRLVR